MSYYDEFPHTRTYDSDLGWLIRYTKANIDNIAGLQEWAAAHKDQYKELKDEVDGLIENLVDVIVPWDSSVAYHIFSIVSWEGTNYIAVQDVPVGTMITNTDYWQPANTVVEQINAIGQTVEEVKQTADDAKEKVDKMIKLSLIEAKLFYSTEINFLQGFCYYPVNDTYIVWSANGTTGTLMEISKDFKSVLRSKVIDIVAHGSGIGYNRNNNTFCMGSAEDRFAYIFNSANFNVVRQIEINSIEYTNFTHLAYDDVNDQYVGWIHDAEYSAAGTGFVILDNEYNLVEFTSKNVQDYYRDIMPGLMFNFQSMAFIDGELYACADFRKNPGTLYDNIYGGAIFKIDTETYDVTQTYFLSKNDFYGEIEGISADSEGYIRFVANSEEANLFWAGAVDYRGDGSALGWSFKTETAGIQTRYKYYYDAADTTTLNLGTEEEPYNNFISLCSDIPFSGSVEIVLKSDLHITNWRNRGGHTTITANGHKVSGVIEGGIYQIYGAYVDATLQILEATVDIYNLNITGAGQLKTSRSTIAANQIHINNCAGIAFLVDGSGTVYMRNVDGSGNTDILVYNNYGLVSAYNFNATTSSSYGTFAGPGLKFKDGVQQ